MAEHATVAAMMLACAEAAVARARELGVQLDYSEQSLELLEEVLTRESAAARGKEGLESAWKMWGGYLGEVVRRRWGGDWSFDSYPQGNFSTPTLSVLGAKLFPTIKVHRRLTEGESENVQNFYQMMSKRLEASPLRKMN